jgi:hypothetical protein
MSNHPTELKHLDKDDEVRVGETIVSGDEGLADSADYQEFVALERVFAEDRLKALTVSGYWSLPLFVGRRGGIEAHEQRKVDWHVLPQLIIIYLLSYIGASTTHHSLSVISYHIQLCILIRADRTNVGNARLFGAEADMGLSATDWNMGLTVFCEPFFPSSSLRMGMVCITSCTAGDLCMLHADAFTKTGGLLINSYHIRPRRPTVQYRAQKVWTQTRPAHHPALRFARPCRFWLCAQ